MIPAEKLPAVRAGDNMVLIIADFARRHRALARRMGDLQKAVKGCQA